MGTYTLKEYSKSVLPRRQRKLKNMKSVQKAGNFMVRRAITLAPKKTGATISGIRGRPNGKNKYIVESIVPGPFYQNLWTNRTPGSRQSVAPKMWWNQDKPTVYGDGSHRITARTPGWFDVAVQFTRKKFKDITVKELHKIMRS